MKFIHCADIHLDSPFALSAAFDSARRRTELRAAFASLVLFAKTEGCRLVLIAGDLFDDALVTKDTCEMLVHEMSAFPDCTFVISPGNHDPYTENSPYRLVHFPENVHIFKEERLSYIDVPGTNVRVYGYAFTSDSMLSSPLAGFSVSDPGKINLLCAHADVDVALSPYCPVPEKDIAASGLDYAAFGHIHKASEIKTAGATRYAYCGCLQGRGFDETGVKGAYLCEVEKDSFSVKPVRFSKEHYEIVHCDLTGAASAGDAAAPLQKAAAEADADTLLRVILEGVTAPTFSADETYVRSLLTKPVYVEIKDETLPLYHADYMKKEGTLVGAFYRNLESRFVSEDAEEREIARLALKLGLKALYGREIGVDG